MYKYLVFFFLSISVCGQDSITTGPTSGSLVIAGGGLIGADITNTFIELAGGKDAAIVVIPTAGGQDDYGEDTRFAKQLREYGATKVTVLHTRDRSIADSDEFTRSLKKAKGVWFSGGRQWRLVDAYAGTQTEMALQQILENGGVIGGTSAGATIQGSFLARGDTATNQIMIGDHLAGFGYIKNIAIDQHVLARNRHFDMFEILNSYPHLLGLGIDESTALVVEGNSFEVIGASKVLIYDGHYWSRDQNDIDNPPKGDAIFYFLQNGDMYDMKSRKVINN